MAGEESSLLHLAAWRGQAAMLRSLLAGGKRQADMDRLCAPPLSSTPLLLAAASGSVASVRALLVAGADPRRRARPDGPTPAEVARAHGCDGAAAVLEEAAAAAGQAPTALSLLLPPPHCR